MVVGIGCIMIFISIILSIGGVHKLQLLKDVPTRYLFEMNHNSTLFHHGVFLVMLHQVG